MRIFLKSIFGCLIVATVSYSQEPKYPFPQRVKYPYGFLPATQKSEHVQEWYESWKAQYPQKCDGDYRPGVDPLERSLVEAQGWAMISAAYMGDKELFDGLYRYYKKKCTSYGCAMMSWKQNCHGFEDKGSATDGDLDVGFSLIVADWQWPGKGYIDKAKDVIKACEQLITDCSGIKTLRGGCANSKPWGGCNETDISYYTPAYFRIFAEVSGNNIWSKLADDTYKILENCAHNKTGLVPDWHTVTGGQAASGRNHWYRYDACRVPWRIALDYLWNGNTKALAWCKKVSSWAYGIGPENILDGYNLDGSLRDGKYHNMAFTGAFAVSAMANSQEIADEFYSEISSMNAGHWYSSYLGNCYLLTLTGNMWRPELTKEKQSSVRAEVTGVKKATKRVILKRLPDSGIAAEGIPVGATVSLVDLSGKEIQVFKCVNSRVVIGGTSMRWGCYILRIMSGSRRIVERRVLIGN